MFDVKSFTPNCTKLFDRSTSTAFAVRLCLRPLLENMTSKILLRVRSTSSTALHSEGHLHGQ